MNINFTTKYLERTAQFASQLQQSTVKLKPEYTQLFGNTNTLTEQYNTTAKRRIKPKETKTS